MKNRPARNLMHDNWGYKTNFISVSGKAFFVQKPEKFFGQLFIRKLFCDKLQVLTGMS